MYALQCFLSNNGYQISSKEKGIKLRTPIQYTLKGNGVGIGIFLGYD